MWFPSLALLALLLTPQDSNPAKQLEEQSRLQLRKQPDNEPAVLQHATALIHLSQPFDAALELEDYLKRHPDSVAAGKLYAALLVDVVDDRKQADEILLHSFTDPTVKAGVPGI